MIGDSVPEGIRPVVRATARVGEGPVVDRHERFEVPHLATLHVEGGAHDHARHAVDQEHRAGVGGPAETVRQCQAAPDDGARSATVPAVERSPTRRESQLVAARPQPPRRIALGIVHPERGIGQHGVFDDERAVDREPEPLRHGDREARVG
jgi:hypothetical protein